MRRQGGYSGLSTTGYSSNLTGSNYTSSYTPTSYSGYKNNSKYSAGSTSSTRATSGYQSYSKSTNLPAASSYSSHISRRTEPLSRSYHPVTRSAERYSTTYGSPPDTSYRPSDTNKYLNVVDSRASRRDSLSDLSPYRTASNSSRQTLSSQYLTPSYQSRESSRESVLTRSWHSPARPAPQLEPRSYSYSNTGATTGRRNYSPSPLRYSSQQSTQYGGVGSNSYSTNVSNSSQLYNSRRDTISKAQDRAESQIRSILNNITNYSSSAGATGSTSHRSRNLDSKLLSPHRTVKENVVTPNYSSFKTNPQSSYMASRYNTTAAVSDGLYSRSKPPGRSGYTAASQLASSLTSAYQPSTNVYSSSVRTTTVDGKPRRSRFLKPKPVEVVKPESDDDYDDSQPEGSNDDSSKRTGVGGKETKKKRRSHRRLNPGLKPPDSPHLLRARKSSWEANSTATPSSVRSLEGGKSSSDEDFTADKNSLEARIKARRKRLQKSKALLHGDQFKGESAAISSQSAYQSTTVTAAASGYVRRDPTMQLTSTTLRPDLAFSQTYTPKDPVRSRTGADVSKWDSGRTAAKSVLKTTTSEEKNIPTRKSVEATKTAHMPTSTFNYADYVSDITSPKKGSSKAEVDKRSTVNGRQKLDFSTLDDLNCEPLRNNAEEEEYRMKTAKQLIEEFSEREKQSKEAELARKKLLQHQLSHNSSAMDVGNEDRRGTESPRFTASSKMSVRSKNTSMDIPVLVVSSPKPTTTVSRDSKVYSSLERPTSKASSIGESHKFHSLDRHTEAKVKVNLWEAGKSPNVPQSVRHVTMPIEGDRVLTVDVPIGRKASPSATEVLEHSAVVARKMEQKGQPIAAKITPSRVNKREKLESPVGPTMIERVDQELLSLLTLGEEMETAHREVYQQCKTAANLNRAQSLMTVAKPVSVQKALRTSLENLSSSRNLTGSRESLNSAPKGWKKPESYEPKRPIANGHHSSPPRATKTRESRETSVVSQISQMNRGAPVSGRTSSLDIASQKIDEMLELARSKHKQEKQNTKFFEAIEELDNIYQSLKTDENANVNSVGSGIKAKLQAIPERRKPEISRRTDSYERLNAISNYPTEPVMTSSLDQEKLNYTRKWLNDDLKSLAHDSKPDLLKFGRSPMDFDQRSIGSASAEVAAICNRQKHSAPHIPDLLVQKKHSALLKPSPIQFAQMIPAESVMTEVVRASRHGSMTSLDSARKNVGRFVDAHKSVGPTPGRLAANENLDNAADKLAAYLQRKELGVVQKRVDQFEVKSAASGDDNESERSVEHRSEAVLSPRRLSLTDHIAEFITKFQPPDADIKIHSDDEARQYSSWRQGQKPTSKPGYAGSTVSLPVTRNPVRQASDPRKLNVFYAPSKSPPGVSPSGFYSAKGDLTDSHGSLTAFRDTRGSNSTLTDGEAMKAPLQPLKMNPMDAVEHLVAELELNTQEVESQKRSFPNDPRNTVDIVALDNDTNADDFQQSAISARRVSSKPHLNAIPEYNEAYENISKAQRMLENIRKNRKPNEDLDDTSHLARKSSIPDRKKQPVAKEPSYSQSPSITPLSAVPSHLNSTSNDRHSPFQVINDEKLCGNRLGQIKNVFEPIHSDNESLTSSQRTTRAPSQPQPSNVVRNPSVKRASQTTPMASSSPDLRSPKAKILPPTPVLAATTAQVSKALQQVEQVLASLDHIQIPKAPRGYQQQPQVTLSEPIMRKNSVRQNGAPMKTDSPSNVFASSFYASADGTNGHVRLVESPPYLQPHAVRNGLENGHGVPLSLHIPQPLVKESEYDNINNLRSDLNVNLNSPEIIKISNVVLGQGGGMSPPDSTRNPIKNFLKRLKGVSGADKPGRLNGAQMDSEGFYSGSTLSLDQSVLSGSSVIDPVDHRARIHKSNSSNESAYFSLHDRPNPSDSDKQELAKLLSSLHVASDSSALRANHSKDSKLVSSNSSTIKSSGTQPPRKFKLGWSPWKKTTT